MTQQKLTVGVTGATGFVGRHLVRELVSRGHSVVALTRSARKAKDVLASDALASGAVRVVEGDALDEGVAERLVAGVDACCHLVGILREGSGRQTFRRVHVRTTERVVEACKLRSRALGRPVRFLQMSALGVGGESTIAYKQTKWDAEQIVRGSGLAWTVFRPSLIHGPDGEFIEMARDWASGRRLPFFFIPAFTRPDLDGKHAGPVPIEWETATVAPVHVDDVAKAFAEALERPGTVGEVYHLAGPEELTMRAVLERVRDEVPLGKPGMRVIGVPGSLAAMKAKAWKLVGLERLMPFDEGMARMAVEDSVAPADKAREDLGFDPRSFSPALRAYASSM